MGFIGDGLLIAISVRNEDKRVKNGSIQNQNLPAGVKKRIAALQKRAEAGDASAAYDLGYRYIYGEEVGYAPDLAVKYFKMAAKQNYFNAAYALVQYYMGNWSYTHVDFYQSYKYALLASKCKCNNAENMAAIQRLLREEFCVSKTERDKNGNPLVWTKHDVKIR